MTTGERSALTLVCAIALLAIGLDAIRERVRAGSPISVARDARPHPPVDVNSAGWRRLTILPGVGASRARSIIAHRERVGGFRSLGELEQVSGIGRDLVDRLRGRVSIGRPGAGPAR